MQLEISINYECGRWRVWGENVNWAAEKNVSNLGAFFAN